MTGYLHDKYAASLADFGIPRALRHSRGWILVRPVDNSILFDGMGLYPIFTCHDWSQLHLDLEELASELVSVSLVTDPFGDYNTEYLHSCFPDVLFPFKEHFVVDLTLPLDRFVHKHHLRNTHKALRTVSVTLSEHPFSSLNDWVTLYDGLIARHNIRGIAKFSRRAFAKQLTVPGVVVFSAFHQNAIVGMGIWYVQGDVAYYHLAAYSALGYELRASYALFWTAMEHLGSLGVRWLDLGAGAGIQERHQDGLVRFKSGWSNTTRQVYFCGRICDRAAYQQILQMRNIPGTSYFPAYRAGEFS